jgi:hypothetical protein
VIAEARHEWTHDSDDLADTLSFLYGEGNWSCDCNRYLDFARATATVENPLADDYFERAECSSAENRYRARVTLDGSIVHDDFPATPQQDETPKGGE